MGAQDGGGGSSFLRFRPKGKEIETKLGNVKSSEIWLPSPIFLGEMCFLFWKRRTNATSPMKTALVVPAKTQREEVSKVFLFAPGSVGARYHQRRASVERSRSSTGARLELNVTNRFVSCGRHAGVEWEKRLLCRVVAVESWCLLCSKTTQC
ncbi:hypothetical protein TRVL_08958 [Trypanosoma vivax]|nr:hypothetical protein TRVL_08958 [Trypanosoma vivax]